MATIEEVTAKMQAAASRRPLRNLAEALEILDALPSLSDAERLTRTVLIDVICKKSPAADAAFEAWAESDDTDMKAPVAAIVAAAKRIAG